MARRERRFIEAVASGMSHKEAIIAAGFKGEQAKDAGWRMMQRPGVKEEIEKRTTDALVSAGVSRVQIVRELARIAFLDPRKLIDENGAVKKFSELDDDTAAALAGMDVEALFAGTGSDRTQVGTVSKVKFWNKREALADLAKIARLVQDAPPAAPPVGPGLQVIVQQVIQSGQGQSLGQRVEVNLPGPGLQV